MMYRLILFFLTFIGFLSCSNPRDKITDEDVYSFMNMVFSPEDTLNQKRILLAHSITFTNLVKSTIWTLNISIPDKIFLTNQIDTNYFVWDCSKIPNVDCLEPAMLSEIFSSERHTIILDTDAVELDAWEIFREVHGVMGFNLYSKPIFNRDKTLVIIEHEWQSVWSGSGHIYVLQKLNDKWELLEHIRTFISSK